MKPSFKPVQSSVIAAIAYEPDCRNLVVKFNSGSVYVYESVSKEEYEDFEKAESKGKYFNRRIKTAHTWYKFDAAHFLR